MQLFLSMSILMLSITTIYAQTSTIGYYITQTNDTIDAQIKIRKGIFGQSKNDFIKEVEVIDSVKGTMKFTPNDIKGFGFLHDGYRYLFVSKPTKNGTYSFLVPVYQGPKASLYQYGINTSGGGSLPSQQVFYTFEKQNNEFLFLKNILNKKFKSQLKDFMSYSPAAQQLIDDKLKYWLDLNKDLLEIMRTANKQ